MINSYTTLPSLIFFNKIETKIILNKWVRVETRVTYLEPLYYHPHDPTTKIIMENETFNYKITRNQMHNSNNIYIYIYIIQHLIFCYLYNHHSFLYKK